MPFSTDRRRVVALMGLVCAGLMPVRPGRAQQSSPPLRPPVGPKPSRSSSCPPIDDLRSEKGSWKVTVHLGDGVATFGSADTVWRVSESPIFKIGLQRLKLQGRPRIEFGSDKPNAWFAVERSSAWGRAGYGPDEDEQCAPCPAAPPGIEVDRLEGQTIRLFARDQEVGRYRLGEKGFDSEQRDKLLDALRRDEPIKASVLVDVQELVFFDATPVATNKAIDEMQRLVREQKSQIAEIRRLNPSSCCLLTTACCEAVGLADDCFELMALRRFRDQVLSRMPQGPREIALYYALAPAILSSIRRTGSERELLRLYFSHILPCAVLAWLGARSLPRVLYTDMVTRLSRRHAAALAGTIGQAPDVRAAG